MRIAWLEPKRARRGWVALVVASLAGIGFFGRGADTLYVAGEGFFLSDADWTLSSGDLPETWRQFEKSRVFDRILTDAPEVYSRLNIHMRQMTGMRWTPLRWRLWFGRPAVLMGIGDDVALTTRAKFSTMVCLGMSRALGLGHIEDNRFRLAGFYIEKVGRFLIISTSPEAFSQLQSRGEVASSFGGMAISYSLNEEPAFDVTVVPEDGECAVIAWINKRDSTDAERAGNFMIDWPTSPIVNVKSRGSSLDIESDLVSDLWTSFPVSQEVNSAWENFEKLLPAGWRTGTDTIQFALFAVDTSETIPIPDAAVYARSETPLGPLTAPVSAIPYEWSGNAGWMTPWQGEGAHLFVVANDRTRAFTNHEATMAALMARERAGRVVSDDALIEVDAPRLSKILIDLTRKAAKNELWPEKNYDDVEHDIVPWLRAFGALGEIRLEGRYENGPLVLRGGTRAPEEAVSPSRDAG